MSVLKEINIVKYLFSFCQNNILLIEKVCETLSGIFLLLEKPIKNIKRAITERERI